MPAELWRPSLDLALHRNRNHPGLRFVQLATVRTDHRPAIRTVVFRGFRDAPDRFLFTTDARSAKRHEIEANPHAAICWYFPETREQFRISGVIDLVGPSTPSPALREARSDVWSELSDAVRASFTWPTPGEPRGSEPLPAAEPPDASHPADDFCLMVLTANEVDHLEMQPDPHRRWVYRADDRGRWSGCEVNP